MPKVKEIECKEIESNTSKSTLDSELIAAARGGDPRAFDELVKRYEKKVARTVIAMLGDSAEADDVGQETFIRFYRSLSSFSGESALGTYLTRIAMNLSLNELKSRKRRILFFRETDDDSAIRKFADNNDLRNDLSVRVADRNLIQWALAKLSSDHRAVITLRLIDGYSTAEVAEALNIPQGTALSRLARAQKKLQKILSPHMRGMR